MQDLTIDLDEGRLNCRAAAIIEHEGKVLLHKCSSESYYALVGGRVQICESSDNTVVREIKEELGKDIELTGYVATIENFFEAKGKNYHEIMFVHKAEFIEEADKKIITDMKNIEGGQDSNVHYEWIEKAKLEEFDIRPCAIIDIIKKGEFPVHIINREK